nr:Chain B, Reaper [synthetic construct]
AVAFYIPDQA